MELVQERVGACERGHGENRELSGILQQGCKAGWGLEESRESVFIFSFETWETK